MRRGLLLTAVATVAAPGLLAMLAVVGHEQAGAAVTASAAALDGPALAGAGASAQSTAPVMISAPEVTRAEVTASLRNVGIRLLQSAATAGLTVSYQGTEATSQSEVDGSAQAISLVWHKADGSTMVETLNDAKSTAAHPAIPDPADVAVVSTGSAKGTPEGVFGVTAGLVGLLGQHYTARYQGGGGSVANRPTSVVELFRADGSIAARYYLDSQTTVPLRRVLYDTSGHEIGDAAFIQVEFGSIALPQPAVAAGAAQSQPARAWTDAAAPAGFVKSLAAHGWQVPASSPGGLPLYAAESTMSSTGEIVDLEYSDGLYDFSLFMQRGTLSAQMSSWPQTCLLGRQVYVSGPSVTWAREGFVYTVIADVPPQTVTQLVSGLPNAPPGVFARLGHGFVRLADVINPFD